MKSEVHVPSVSIRHYAASLYNRHSRHSGLPIAQCHANGNIIETENNTEWEREREIFCLFLFLGLIESYYCDSPIYNFKTIETFNVKLRSYLLAVGGWREGAAEMSSAESATTEPRAHLLKYRKKYSHNSKKRICTCQWCSCSDRAPRMPSTAICEDKRGRRRDAHAREKTKFADVSIGQMAAIEHRGAAATAIQSVAFNRTVWCFIRSPARSLARTRPPELTGDFARATDSLSDVKKRDKYDLRERNDADANTRPPWRIRNCPQFEIVLAPEAQRASDI